MIFDAVGGIDLSRAAHKESGTQVRFAMEFTKLTGTYRDQMKESVTKQVDFETCLR